MPTIIVIPQLPDKSCLHHITAMDHYEAAEENGGCICIPLQERDIPVYYCPAQTHRIKRQGMVRNKTEICLESWWEAVHPEMAACPAPAALSS